MRLQLFTYLAHAQQKIKLPGRNTPQLFQMPMPVQQYRTIERNVKPGLRSAAGTAIISFSYKPYRQNGYF
jgi:hypothetical protein